MYHPQNYQAYANAAMTTSKLRQVIMLYDGMIRFMQQSAEAIKVSDFETRYNLTTKTINIVQALQSALDFQRGQDISNILYGYYANLEQRMYALHRSNDIKQCEAIIKDIKVMRDAWQNIELAENEEKAKASVSHPAMMNAAMPAAVANAAVIENMSFSA